MISKKLLAAAAALTMFISGSAFAQHSGTLGYGDEWENYESVSVTSFRDVPQGHWAYDAIDRVVAKGWFEGYPDNTFHPNAEIERAEAMKVFVQFLGLQLKNTEVSSYNDVAVTDWYSPYIEAGKDLFPPKVNFDGSVPFLPKQPITREDVCYALVIAKGYEPMTVNADQSVLNMFSDQNSISANVKDYVAVAVSNGLISGYPDGTIGAQDPLTRAEFATMLYRATFVGTQG